MPEAAAAYRRAIELDPNFAMAHRSLGQVVLGQEQTQAAIEHLERAAELDPSDSIALTTLAQAYSRLGLRTRGEAALAERHLGNATALDGQLTAAHKELADLTQQARRTGEAARHMRRVVDLAPEDDDARARLASLLGTINDFDGAIAEFESLAKRRAPNAEVRHNWGTVLMRRGRHREAVEHFRAALRENSANSGTLYNLGLSLENLGRANEAMTSFRESSALDPSGPAAKRLAPR